MGSRAPLRGCWHFSWGALVVANVILSQKLIYGIKMCRVKRLGNGVEVVRRGGTGEWGARWCVRVTTRRLLEEQMTVVASDSDTKDDAMWHVPQLHPWDKCALKSLRADHHAIEVVPYEIVKNIKSSRSIQSYLLIFFLVAWYTMANDITWRITKNMHLISSFAYFFWVAIIV